MFQVTGKVLKTADHAADVVDKKENQTDSDPLRGIKLSMEEVEQKADQAARELTETPEKTEAN